MKTCDQDGTETQQKPMGMRGGANASIFKAMKLYMSLCAVCACHDCGFALNLQKRADLGPLAVVWFAVKTKARCACSSPW